MSNAAGMTQGARRRARKSARGPLLAAAVSLALAAGCRQDMHDAPRYDPLEASVVFPHGASAQPLVDGTVARDHVNDDELLETGRMNGQTASVFPFAITRADMDRGQERFNIYCSPCHGREGDGNGMVVQRGYRLAASLHTDRLRQATPGYLYDVMRNGFGVMPDYRAQITVEDRWRIVAYIRALQLSRNAATSDVSAGEISKLDAPATATGAAAEPKGPTGGHD
jgi:mono/diheme cytochrome c family protein